MTSSRHSSIIISESFITALKSVGFLHLCYANTFSLFIDCSTPYAMDAFAHAVLYILSTITKVLLWHLWFVSNFFHRQLP